MPLWARDRAEIRANRLGQHLPLTLSFRPGSLLFFDTSGGAPGDGSYAWR
jgi:hypothetical protein